MSNLLGRLLEKAVEGQGEVTIPVAGGWKLRLTENKEGECVLRLYNPGPDGGEKFFAISNDYPYGGSKMIQEPTLGVTLEGVGEKYEAVRIVAPIIIEDGKITMRLSWSRLVYVEKKTFVLDKDGCLFIDGKLVGYLVGVFLTDKNRLDGYVGIFDTKKQITLAEVQVQELESVALAQYGIQPSA